MATKTNRTDASVDPTAGLSHDIKAYLDAIEQPDSLMDDEKVGTLESTLSDDRSLTLAEQLHLQVRLEKLRDTGPKMEELAEKFVKAIPKYANEMGVDIDIVLRVPAMGTVPDDVKLAIRSGATSVKTKPRRVSQKDVENWITQRTRPFTVKDVEDATGASSNTARRVIKAKLDAAQLKADDASPINYSNV